MPTPKLLQLIPQFADLIKIQHTVFALPFALISALIAWKTHGSISWLDFLAIILCMVCARSAAMAFNRYIDRGYDAENPRTASRHLPKRSLSESQVLFFIFFTSLAFILSTGLFLKSGNFWPLAFSIPTLLFLFSYSYAKRFTSLCHFWLGLALALSPPAAWVAIRGLVWNEAPIPLMLSGAVLFWVAGFDILYAAQDTEFDQKAGLQSIPARLGVGNALRLAFICHLIMLGFLIAFYYLASPPLGKIYLTGVGVTGLLVMYQHSLVKPNDLNRVNQAFFHVNAVISLGMLAVVILQLQLGW